MNEGVDTGEPSDDDEFDVEFDNDDDVDEDDDVVDVAIVVSNRHRMGPANALSKVIDTEVPPLVNPARGATAAWSSPEVWMEIAAECKETSAPYRGGGVYDEGVSGGGRGGEGVQLGGREGGVRGGRWGG